MPELCYVCRTRYATKPKTIGFDYKGFHIIMFKDGLHCSYCKESGFKKLFKQYVHLFTHAEGKITSINWGAFCEECDRRERECETQIVELFLLLGIFSHAPTGNWEIVSDTHIPLNPRFSFSIAYFTNFTDATDFAKEKYANTVYDWQVRCIKEAYNKEEVMKLEHLDRNEINLTFEK